METSITKLSPVEYELDIRANRDALEERIDQALRKIRPSIQMKGFRPGKVPMGMVKRLHGQAVAYEVVDQLIQETYKAEVLDSPEHDVLGQPTIMKLDYEPDGDLRALVQFGVRPDVVLANLSGEKITRLTHEVTDEEVESEIENLRARAASFDAHDQPAGEDDFVVVDLQQLDMKTGTPLVGAKQEGVAFYLGSDEIDQQAKNALTGTTVGDLVKFNIVQDEHDHEHRYEATVTVVQRRTLPEADDAFASEATGGRVETFAELKTDIAKQMRRQWDRVLRDKLEDDLVRHLVDLHQIDVPPSVVDLYLDSQIDDLARRNEGKLPEDFDVEYFKDQNRDEAERMARWMLIRDQIINQNEIAVESDDLDEAFSDMGREEEDSGESIRKTFEKHYPNMIPQMERRLENKKVFEWLLEQFEIEDQVWQDDRD